MRGVRIWIGLVLLALGVFGVLDATGTLESTGTIERWWPIAIVGAATIAMIGHRRVTIGGLILLAIGLALLAAQQEWADDEVIGPAILVAIGIAVLAGATARATRRSSAGLDAPLALFGGATSKRRDDHLTRADVTALFGGATLDLREAHIDQEATVEATAIFGGVDVLVPHGWRVAISGVPIFGGYEDKTTSDGSLPANAPRLNVRATAIFGGVGVAHEAT
jgi:hypothetical protein